MRVSKIIKGEKYTFYSQFILNEKKTKVRYFQTDEWVICDISEDFNFILLPKNKFIFNGVEVKKLKLNKRDRFEAMEHNGINL